MERLSGENILVAWEVGANRGPIDRALALLWAGGFDQEIDQDLADLPLGLRDRQLLKLRATTFGDALNCMTKCPSCKEPLEVALSTSALMKNMAPPVVENIKIGDREFQLRPLNSRDLAEASNCPSIEDAANLLRHRICGCTAEDIPNTIAEELDSQIETREAGTELSLSLSCFNCSHSWLENLDIAEFFWTELEHRALRILSEIAELAKAFSWSEQEILKLSSRRRKTYLTLARGA